MASQLGRQVRVADAEPRTNRPLVASASVFAPARRRADRSGRTAAPRSAPGSRRRSAARACRRAPGRRDSRSGRGSSRRPAGSAPDRSRGALARATVTLPVSSGWRSASSTCALELRQLVQEQHTLVRERDLARPGVAAAADHCGHRGARGAGCGMDGAGSAGRSAAGRRRWIMLTSSISAASSGGSRPGRRAASIDLPAPGGPTISRLWPPAAAISSARLRRLLALDVA